MKHETTHATKTTPALQTSAPPAVGHEPLPPLSGAKEIADEIIFIADLLEKFPGAVPRRLRQGVDRLKTAAPQLLDSKPETRNPKPA